MSSKRVTKTKLQSELHQRIRKEAKALGLTQKEYLRLTLAVSKALRESFGDASGLELKSLLSFVESPMFSVLLSGIVKTALSSMSSSSQSEEDSAASGSQETQSPGATRGHVANPPMPMWHPGNIMPQRRPAYGNFYAPYGGPAPQPTPSNNAPMTSPGFPAFERRDAAHGHPY